MAETLERIIDGQAFRGDPQSIAYGDVSIPLDAVDGWRSVLLRYKSSLNGKQNVISKTSKLHFNVTAGGTELNVDQTVRGTGRESASKHKELEDLFQALHAYGTAYNCPEPDLPPCTKGH